MNRLVRGSVILAAAVTSWACGGLDTGDIEATDRLVGDPTVVFVNNNDSQAVFIEALNALGQQLEGNFAISNVGAGIVVTQDTAFAPLFGIGHLPTRARYFVRPLDFFTFVSSDFTITANGKSLTIPVSITPANLPGTFSTLAPAANDTVTLSAPAPLKFTPQTTITFGTGFTAVITSLAADSSSISFVPVPGSNGVANVTGLVLPYLSAEQTLNTTDQISVGTLSGTDAFATAPTIPFPDAAETVLFRDAGAFSPNATCLGDNGGPCRIYTFTLAAPTTFTFTASWQGSTDLGVYFYDSGFNLLNPFPDACDALGAGGGGQPETCTKTYGPGTFYMTLVTFSAFYAAPNNVDPTFLTFTITNP